MSHRRLENANLELDVPLEHIEQEALPLEIHETLGVGYASDRLYMIRLDEEQPVPRPLPGRHELLKFGSESLENHRLGYRGLPLHLGAITDAAIGTNYARSYSGNRIDWLDNRGGALGAAIDAWSGYHLQGNTPTDMISNFARAFIGPGTATQQGQTTTIGWHVGSGNNAAGRNTLQLDYETLTDLGRNEGDMFDDGTLGTLNLLYNLYSPSAWDTVVANASLFEEFPRILPHLDKALYSLYERDKIGAFATRVRDVNLLYLALSCAEAMYTIKRGRFSKNIGTHSQSETMMASIGPNNVGHISNGVMNAFFAYFDLGSNGQFVIAPWWLANKLNHVLYLDTDRDEEVRTPERADMIDFMHLILEAMEFERGIHFSSESNFNLAVFDTYKEGKLPSFENFTDTNAAFSATLLGYESPRDTYYRRTHKDANGNDALYTSRLPYFHTLLSDSGTIIGRDLKEFTDRIAEMSDATVITPSTEWFKKGMQIANPIDYNTMVTRTRFGDASARVKITPGGFSRLAPSVGNDMYYHRQSSAMGLSNTKTVSNVLWFPLYGWSQMAEVSSSQGLLPNGRNGCYHIVNTTAPQPLSTFDSAPVATTTNGLIDQELWNANYWRPGRDNYTLRLLQSTDPIFRAWMDRGDAVRQEGATFPTLSTMNLTAEMTFTTPLALLQRNLPYLRKMMTVTSREVIISPQADDSIDFMTFGDNWFNVSLVADQHGHTGGPLALRDRRLQDPTYHTRAGDLELASIVMPLSTLPDNWVSVFQTRDWLYANTSLLAEPIMDSYSFPFNNPTSSGKRNAFCNARLVIYQGPKTFEGRVEDVYCTPLLGCGARYLYNGTDYVKTANQLEFDGSSLISVFPRSSQISSKLDLYNYTMFLLSPENLRSGHVLLGRYGRSSTNATDADAFLMSATDTYGAPRYHSSLRSYTHTLNKGSSFVTEEDFTPGLHWTKLPWQNVVQPQYWNGTTYVDIPFSRWFATVGRMDASGNGYEDGIHYLQLKLPRDANGNVTGTAQLWEENLPNTITDETTGFKLGQDNYEKDEWRMTHIRFLENYRDDLEFQRAGNNFVIIDLDITDKTESFLRQSLINLGFSTTGPLTFVGTVGPEGQQVGAETITGSSVFEIVSLTMGAGSLDESPSQADDMQVGEANPSMHIVDAKDV